MDRFYERLRSNAHVPPVLFYAEHVNMWSADWLWLESSPTGARLLTAESDIYKLACYPLPDRGILRRDLLGYLRLKSIRERNPQEQRWLVLLLLEAVLAWEPMVGGAAIVLVRREVGGTVFDPEIVASLRRVPAWVRGNRKRRTT